MVASSTANTRFLSPSGRLPPSASALNGARRDDWRRSHYDRRRPLGAGGSRRRGGRGRRHGGTGRGSGDRGGARGGARRLVVDLSAARSLDSKALDMLPGVRRRLVAEGGDLRVVNVRGDVLHAFAVTGLTCMFAIDGRAAAT